MDTSDNNRGRVSNQLGLHVTRHAVDRFQERVASVPGRAEANARLATMVRTGTIKIQPRWWTDAKWAPGTRFLYSAGEPGVCLVVQGDAVTTVLTRDLCRSRHRVLESRPQRAPKRGRTTHRRATRDDNWREWRADEEVEQWAA